MEVKTYISVDPKFVFEKIEFKDLQYISHGFICQSTGISKDQTSTFESLAIK